MVVAEEEVMTEAPERQLLILLARVVRELAHQQHWTIVARINDLLEILERQEP